MLFQPISSNFAPLNLNGMELGVGMFGDLNINSKGEVQPTGQRLQEIIEEIKLMDESDLYFFWN